MNKQIRLLAGLVVAFLGVLGLLPAAALGFPVLFAGDTATTSDYEEMMKVVWDDTLIRDTVADTELLSEFDEGETKSGSDGRYFETAHLVQFPGSVGSRGENGYVPQAGKARAVNGRNQLKKIMASLQETAEVLKKIRADKAAFLTWSDEQFPLMKESLSNEIDRQMCADGSGLRARVAESSVVNPVVVDSTFGIAGLDNPLMQFQRGMKLRASANADGSSPRATVYTVEQLDWDNNALELDAVTNLVDNDYLFEGDSADNSAGKDIMGLMGLIDDGGVVETLQNIDRSEELWFQSYVNDLNAGDLTEYQLLRTDRIARQRGAGRVDLIVTSELAFDIVWAALKADRAINDPRAYAAGRSGIDVLFGGTRVVKLKTVRKMPNGLVFGIQKNQIRKFLLHEFQWDRTTGSIWRQVSDSTGVKDAFFAYGSAHMEVGIKSPQKCWRIENFDVTESGLI